MNRLFCCLFFLLYSTVTLSTQDSHNLDFEELDGDQALGWSVFPQPGYKVTFAHDIANSGEVSGAIESISDNSEYTALSYSIPADFGGKKIKLSGYLKTENVDGYAGLWMRIDPNIAFDNMASKNINGTNEWTKYEIECVRR